MKKTLLLVVVAFAFIGTQAQTKSTGVVNLTTGMTAKLDLNNTNTTATLTLTGPSDRWFALQFGSFVAGSGMQAGEDVVYFNGTTLVDAVHNGIGAAPSTDTNSWTVTSNAVASGTRTIVANRAFNTGEANDYPFVFSNTSIDFAYARMSSASFSLAYHGGGNRGYVIDAPMTTLGVNDFELEKIVFYPNPASDFFNIQSQQEIKTITIFDATGKRVANFENQKEKVDISNLKSGIYFVEIVTSENKTFTEKIVKK